MIKLFAITDGTNRKNRSDQFMVNLFLFMTSASHFVFKAHPVLQPERFLNTWKFRMNLFMSNFTRGKRSVMSLERWQLIFDDYETIIYDTFSMFKQLNPQRELPVLDDNGFLLSEHIAILQVKLEILFSVKLLTNFSVYLWQVCADFKTLPIRSASSSYC